METLAANQKIVLFVGKFLATFWARSINSLIFNFCKDIYFLTENTELHCEIC